MWGSSVTTTSCWSGSDIRKEMAVLIMIAGNQAVGVRELLRMLAYALFYANVTGVLGIWAMGRFAQGLALRKLPQVPLVAVGIMGFTVLGCLLAQALSMEMGYVIPQHFWRQGRI
jgi:hypothetical protein